MPIPLPPTTATQPVVPLHDVLAVLAVLVVLAIGSNLALYAYISTQSSLSNPPSPGRRECVWEKGPGDEGPSGALSRTAGEGRGGEPAR